MVLELYVTRCEQIENKLSQKNPDTFQCILTRTSEQVSPVALLGCNSPLARRVAEIPSCFPLYTNTCSDKNAGGTARLSRIQEDTLCVQPINKPYGTPTGMHTKLKPRSLT